MKSLESYHIVGFLVAYLSLYQHQVLQLPQITLQKQIYLLCALAPFLMVVSSSDCATLEQLVLVLAYAFFIRGISTVVYLQKEKPTEVTLENYGHMVFLISTLMLIYNKKTNIYGSYVAMAVFSTISLLSNKITISFCVHDYILLHLLFFFTK